ncbi:hypothetical protein CMO92_01005 [Candidatus Woesearchaeota archaeon]|nr:hypothetical protein [Candidatus Woesearchaeota archaeon]
MPENMDECLYFSRRANEFGQATAWVEKEECPECHKAKMGKPTDKGKVKIRAKEYVCPACGHEEEKTTYEPTLTVNVNYTCSCGHKGEAQTPYKRKKFQGTDAYLFECSSCNQKIPITKKMANLKKKKKKA